MRSLFCVCMYPPINFWIPEPIFLKLAVYIMTPEPISTAYFINPSHQSLCLYIYVARQRLGKNVAAATNTHVTIKELLDASFCMQSSSCKRKVGYSWQNFCNFMHPILTTYSRSVNQKTSVTNPSGVSGRLPRCSFLFRSPFNKDFLLLMTVIPGSERLKIFPVNVIKSRLRLLEAYIGWYL
jgi:hypothetical protein